MGGGGLIGVDINRAGDDHSVDQRRSWDEALSDGDADGLGDDIRDDLAGVECPMGRGGGDQSSAEDCENGGGTHLGRFGVGVVGSDGSGSFL
jgi:hypothetical protein